ncbi:MAG: rRNA maturation RNase YbeY [Acidobacteria bacterium]|jgi:probable rRNA maturation factor|nr:rRNA maturation RNase YbeY [Acidobacteriota bacterium]
MPEIINNQRKIKINKGVFQTFAEIGLEKISETEGKDFTVAFVSDRKMREFNKTFRGKNLTTDVLSFPFEANEFDVENNNLGDIAISLEQAERQAAENNLDLDTEIKQLILHGVLHLCGYDHETDSGEMNRRELELREVLKIN